MPLAEEFLYDWRYVKPNPPEFLCYRRHERLQ